MGKSSLSTTDMDLVISDLDAFLCRGDDEGSLRPMKQERSLARRLLLVFCFQSVGGGAVVRHVLSRVCDLDSFSSSQM